MRIREGGSFRKKPVVVQAWMWRGASDNPDRFRGLSDSCHPVGTAEGGSVLLIQTLEGVMQAQPGDVIIRGVKGELYPCKPDIFEATYEAASAPRQLYERVDPSEPCQFVGVHPLQWGKADEPVAFFREVE